MVKVGLVGCGLISGAHRRGFAAVADKGQLMWICDRDAALAERTAAEAGVARWTADFAELLADPELDAVDLCLPHHLHRPFTEQALAAGKHVLCEKPIATSLADADAMLAAAQAAGKVLMIAEQCRFEPSIPLTRQLIADGAIGEVIHAGFDSSWWQGGGYLDTAWRFDPATMGGGVLIDGGMHRVDMLLHLLGQPRRVSCLTRTVREVFAPTEDTVALAVEFVSGVLATLTITQSTRTWPEELFRLCGTEGRLVARRGNVEVHRPQAEPELHAVPKWEGFATEIGHFLDCCATGATPLMDGAAARADLEFVLAAYRSAATGRTVELPLTED